MKPTEDTLETHEARALAARWALARSSKPYAKNDAPSRGMLDDSERERLLVILSMFNEDFEAWCTSNRLSYSLDSTDDELDTIARALAKEVGLKGPGVSPPREALVQALWLLRSEQKRLQALGSELHDALCEAGR